MKKFFAGLVVASSLALCGCMAQYSPTANVVKSDEIDFTKLGELKKGSSCGLMQILFFPPFGTASLKEAATTAGIAKLKLVDYEVREFLLFRNICVTAYGN
jgi:hypothetical protein